MNVKQWLHQTQGEPQLRQAVAAAAGTTVGYLWQLAGKHRGGSPELLRALHAASLELSPDRVMTLAQLNPRIWGEPLKRRPPRKKSKAASAGTEGLPG